MNSVNCNMLFNALRNTISVSLCCFFVGLGSICAQNIKFEHYNDNDGLSHNSVRHIVQDETGFLWLGTFSGLNRFDGYQFKSYLGSNAIGEGLFNDDITALELDNDANNLWIGTRNGLTLLKLDTNTFQTFLPQKDDKNSIGDNEIRSIHVDELKQVWVGTKTQGLYRYFPKENRFSKVELEGFEYIKEIFQDKSGNIWVGSYDNVAIAKITLDQDGKIDQISNYELIAHNTAEKNPYINFIYEDHKSDIFVGTRNGLFKLDQQNNRFEHLYIENEQVRDQLGPYFVSIARSPEGKYWVGTLGGLLITDELEAISVGDFEWHYTVLSDDTSIVNNLISALYFDSSGVLWIGTDDGLDKYDPYENQFKLNKNISRFIENQVPRIRGFTKTFDKKLLVATRRNGLFLIDENKTSHLLEKKYDIASIYSDDGKKIYCGLWNGEILVYDYLAKTTEIVSIGFENSPVLTLKSLNDSTLVAGSFGEGAVLLDKNTLQPKNSGKRILPGSSINKIAFDSKKGELWLATEIGVGRYHLQSGKTTNYYSNSENRNHLPHDNVSDVLIDAKGKIWAATRLGLSTYDVEKNQFTALAKPKELLGKWITDMVLDTNGDLWLNMNNSVAKLNTETYEANSYNINSGNRLDVFSSSGFYHEDGSTIFLAGKNGVIYFSPYTLKENYWAPQPFISEFKVQNRPVLYGSKINDQQFLTKGLNYDKSIALNYENRNFSLQFSSPSYSNVRLNKFEYMLDGFDEDWVQVNSNSRTVQYTNLYPKDYTFKLKASNSNGQWSETSTYDIHISPPFWLTYKAFFLAFVVLLALVFLTRREIKNRLKLKQALLVEKLKQERNEKLNNEKFRFFTNISHELRTPLTLILGPVKDLLQHATATKNEFQESRSKLIHQNANRLLNLVNQILDFRKAQTGELSLKVSKVAILERAKTIFNSFQDLAKNKQISFNFITEDESILGWIDKDKLDKILYNLLSNAIKFTNTHGNVDVFMGLNDDIADYLLIEVSDTGIGIPEASQKNIFSRFYQTRTSKENNTGSGIGLSLVKSLVTIHKGEIALQSKPGKGTVFTVKLPISKKFFQKDEIQEFVAIPASEELQLNRPKKKLLKTTHLKQKIVLIEDNAELRTYLVDYLSDFYKVFSAENGKDGLRICRQIKPLLCIADVMMPIMDGIEFCRKLKKDEFISHIPVILLTALSENEDKAKGFDVGADGYVVKPFDPSLLKTRIANIITTRLELKEKFSREVASEISLLTHSPLDEDFMKKITCLIDDNITEADLTTSFLCKELGMSSSKLYRKIKELTDLAPNEFIRTVRLKKSAPLLRSKKYNVSEVTTLIGFNDPLYFSRCFKKQFGFPPSALLKDEARIDSL